MKNNGVVLVVASSDGAAAITTLAHGFSDWRVELADVETCCAADVAACTPDLLVVHGAASLVAAVRALDGPTARVPVVVVAAAGVEGADEHLREIGPAEAGVLARRWTPQPLPDLDRLAAALGAEEIRRLASGLRDQLVVALKGLDDDGGDPALAHRVAGFAGMLGLGALGQRWNAVSHGARDGIPALRIDTRRAIAALDRAVASPMPLV